MGKLAQIWAAGDVVGVDLDLPEGVLFNVCLFVEGE